MGGTEQSARTRVEMGHRVAAAEEEATTLALIIIRAAKAAMVLLKYGFCKEKLYGVRLRGK